MHDTLQKLHYDIKNEPPYFITTFHPTQVATFLFPHPFVTTSYTTSYLPMYPSYLHTYIPTYLPTHLLLQSSLSVMLLLSLTSCDSHFTITKFPQHLLPWPTLVTPNLYVPWPPTTPSIFHLRHAYICLHLSLFPCHTQAVNFKLVIIFLVLYIYMK
jgi:hypothetical protein